MSLKMFMVSVAILMAFTLFYAEASEELDFGEDTSAQLTYDFGQVNEGDKVTHIFEVLNGSKFLWQIEGLVTSCGCVSAKLVGEKEKKEDINPGELFGVEVEVDTAGHDGDLEQFVYVNIKQENENKILKLNIKGKVIKKLESGE